jgi:hypothetical protein
MVLLLVVYAFLLFSELIEYIECVVRVRGEEVLVSLGREL